MKMKNEEEKFWNDLYSHSTRTNQSPYGEDLKKKISEVVPDDVKTVLDAGCGAGGLMLYLAKFNNLEDIQGVDFSSVAVDYVNKTLKMKAQVGDLTQLSNYKDNSFDLVVCSEVTEHIPPGDLTQCFEELRRVAKKYIVITNPYKEKLRYYQVQCHHCNTHFHPAGHIHCVDESFVKSKLKSKVQNIKYYFSGERESRFMLFGSFIRMMKWDAFFSYDIYCPCCNSLVDFTKYGIIGRIMISGMKKLQLSLKSIGIYDCPNNIITFIEI